MASSGHMFAPPSGALTVLVRIFSGQQYDSKSPTVAIAVEVISQRSTSEPVPSSAWTIMDNGSYDRSIGGDVLSNNTTVNIHSFREALAFLPVDYSDVVIAAPGSSTSISRHGRGYMPTSNTPLYGRDLDLDFIVERLVWKPEMPPSKRACFALLGTGGMGNSSLVLQVMRDPRLLAVYRDSRI
ncbi:hypothetical protein C8J56DRAFT_1101058 [Mycena floridula]|nr:hypothetical protein C8J56DRAFT_1101058 [Mycena floridula]